MTVKRLIEKSAGCPAYVTPDALVKEVLEYLDREDVGALVVSPDGKSISGIISERDIVRGLRRYRKTILSHPVTDLMTHDVVTCELDDSVVNVMALMDRNGIRHVPVIDHGKLIGIISIRDIVKDRLSEVQHEADAMRSYIAGAA